MSVGQQQEVEIKLSVPDYGALVQDLVRLGFVEIIPRTLEQNVIYDTPEGTLRARGELIRLRQMGGRSIFTYKGPATVSRHKEREEIELDVSSAEAMATILTRLGMEPRFRYEKYRAEWQRPGEAGIVMVDETPIGTYMELEGPSEWIDRTAAELEYDESQYINASYARLHSALCRERGEEPGHMVFPAVLP